MEVEKRFCERCRVEIPAARLEAVPDTAVCVACSREMGGEFEVIAVPENSAKANSLKKNYSGWTIRKRRKHIEPKA